LATYWLLKGHLLACKRPHIASQKVAFCKLSDSQHDRQGGKEVWPQRCLKKIKTPEICRTFTSVIAELAVTLRLKNGIE